MAELMRDREAPAGGPLLGLLGVPANRPLLPQGRGRVTARRNRPDPRPERPLTEREANAFAAAMLMSADLVEQPYHATERDFEKLCELLGSSQRAMGRRLRAVIE